MTHTAGDGHFHRVGSAEWGYISRNIFLEHFKTLITKKNRQLCTQAVCSCAFVQTTDSLWPRPRGLLCVAPGQQVVSNCWHEEQLAQDTHPHTHSPSRKLSLTKSHTHFDGGGWWTVNGAFLENLDASQSTVGPFSIFRCDAS